MYRFIKVDKFDIGQNFWENNYQIRFIEPFKELYDRDKTENKQQSSNEMWCLWLYCDPSYSNKIGKLPEEEKKSAILAYYPKFNFKDEVINKCIISYSEKCLSEAAQLFRTSLKSIQTLQNAIDDKLISDGVTFNETINIGNNRYLKKEGTAKQITSLKKEMVVLWREYDKIKKQFEEEQSELRLYGGGKQTLMESGGLRLIKDEEE